MTSIALGDHVVTSDGHVIGVVKEMTDVCFKVNVPLWPDHWVGLDSVDEVSTGEVHLKFDQDYVSSDVKDGVGHTGFHVHDQG